MKRKTSVIVLTAILVLLVFAVFVMPVSAQSITIAKPPDGATVSDVTGINTTIADFTDFNGYVNFSYSLDNSTWTLINQSVTSTDLLVNATWDTTTVPDDVYFLNATAINTTDKLAAYNFSANINVDNADQVILDVPANGTTVSGVTNLNATTFNTTTGLPAKVQNATFYYKNSQSDAWVMIGINDTLGDYTHFNQTWDTTTVPDDVYSIKVVTNDGLVNVSGNINVDNADQVILDVPANITVITNYTSPQAFINLNATTFNTTTGLPAMVQNATFRNSTDGVNWVYIGIND
ncbi:MAG: hypothetical protein QMC77_08940, partial [Methanocellales archaeon]|nr:hypothetical protein [Methanocellales archaeon]